MTSRMPLISSKNITQDPSDKSNRCSVGITIWKMSVVGRKRVRHPLWRQGLTLRIRAFLRQKLSLRNSVLSLLFLLALPILVDLFRDAVIIDPISVPESYEKAGLNPHVMSTRIQDALNAIEVATKTSR